MLIPASFTVNYAPGATPYLFTGQNAYTIFVTSLVSTGWTYTHGAGSLSNTRIYQKTINGVLKYLSIALSFNTGSFASVDTSVVGSTWFRPLLFWRLGDSFSVVDANNGLVSAPFLAGNLALNCVRTQNSAPGVSVDPDDPGVVFINRFFQPTHTAKWFSFRSSDSYAIAYCIFDSLNQPIFMDGIMFHGISSYNPVYNVLNVACLNPRTGNNLLSIDTTNGPQTHQNVIFSSKPPFPGGNLFLVGNTDIDSIFSAPDISKKNTLERPPNTVFRAYPRIAATPSLNSPKACKIVENYMVIQEPDAGIARPGVITLSDHTLSGVINYLLVFGHTNGIVSDFSLALSTSPAFADFYNSAFGARLPITGSPVYNVSYMIGPSI